MKKQKLPAFVIADNPMTDPPRTFIIHLRYPFVVAELNDDCCNLIGLWNEPLTGEWLTDPLKMAGLMRRMGDWYIAYCNWEDEKNF